MKQGKIPYNFTPVDNNWIDHEMRFATGAEAKVYIYVARKTIGTKVTNREASISTKELQYRAGISRDTARLSVAGIERHGWVTVERGKTGSHQIKKIVILDLDKEKYIREKLEHLNDVEITTVLKITSDSADNKQCEASDSADNKPYITDVTDIKTAEGTKKMEQSVKDAQFLAGVLAVHVKAVYDELGIKYKPKTTDMDFNPIYDMIRIDHYAYSDLLDAIEFVFIDQFWRTIIKATAGFKKNYAQIRIAMSKRNNNPNDLSKMYS